MAVLLGLLAVGLALALAGGGGLQGGDGTQNDVAEGTGSFLSDVRVRSMRSGRLVWVMNTSRVDIDSGSDTARLDGVVINMPGHDLSITARSGTFDLGTQDLVLEDGVEASGKGVRVETARVSLDASEGKVSSDEVITVTGRNFTASGRGFTATEEGISIHSDVKANLR